MIATPLMRIARPRSTPRGRSRAQALACCAWEARAESMDALYEQAKLEKTVVLYGAGQTGSHDRWIKDFEQRFPGVTVAFTGGLSTDLNQRIEGQLASAAMETDLAILPPIPDSGKSKNQGPLPPPTPADST